jgi:hypothetical protein
MTYEQLLEMADNAGAVSKGLTQAQIDKVRTNLWMKGRTKADSCSICMEEFKSGSMYKQLPCKHEYHAECISEWLRSQKKCPICQKDVIAK